MDKDLDREGIEQALKYVPSFVIWINCQANRVLKMPDTSLTVDLLGPILLTWFNFNLSMDK